MAISYHNLEYEFSKRKDVPIFEQNTFSLVSFSEAMQKTEVLIPELITRINNYIDKRSKNREINLGDVQEFIYINKAMHSIYQISKRGQEIYEKFAKGVEQLKPRLPKKMREDVLHDLQNFQAGVVSKGFEWGDKKYTQISKEYEQISQWKESFKSQFEELEKTVNSFNVYLKNDDRQILNYFSLTIQKKEQIGNDQFLQLFGPLKIKTSQELADFYRTTAMELNQLAEKIDDVTVSMGAKEDITK